MNQDLLKRYASFRNLLLFFLLAIAISLPLSKYLASAAQILLAAAWLAEGKFDEKWRRIRSRPQILVFTLLFLIPLLGMVYTQDVQNGMSNLRIKLPFLLLPLVLGSIKPLNNNEMRIILGGFTTAVIIGALISVSIMLGIGPAEYTSDRETILFISHIRFALMVVLAIFILFHYAFDPLTPHPFPLILFPLALSLVFYLFLLKSLSGVVVLTAGGMLLVLRWGLKQTDFLLRWFVIVGLATIPVLTAVYLSGQAGQFHTVRDTPGKLDAVTVNGNPYVHDTASQMLENGYHVGYYLCETELSGAWNQVSELDYAGTDRKGQELRYTLIRYLTSLGLRKDAYGVSQLKPDDISLIENGFANCLYKNPGRFKVRIYEVVWEIDQYRRGANPSGHSVTQRLEYLKAGWAIFKDHPLLGVGTGDIRSAFERKYEELNSRLDPEWRLLAHNQYLTFLISYGLIGFLLILTAIFLPVFLVSGRKNYFVLMFLVVALLSMLNEDTLETQAGVAFFGIFYCLFVFADGTTDLPRHPDLAKGKRAGGQKGKK